MGGCMCVSAHVTMGRKHPTSLSKRGYGCAGSWDLLRSLYADMSNYKRPSAQESTFYGGVT